MMQAASAATEADKKIGGIGKCCHKCEQPAKFICQAKIACKERGCGKPFCSDHRARKCNGKSNKEYVCCDCEDEANNASWFCGIGCGVLSCCSCVACWVILCYVIIPLLFVTAAKSAVDDFNDGLNDDWNNNSNNNGFNNNDKPNGFDDEFNNAFDDFDIDFNDDCFSSKNWPNC